MKYKDIKPRMVLLEEIEVSYASSQLEKCYSIILVKTPALVRLIEVYGVKGKWLCKPRTVYEENWSTKGWWRGRRVRRKIFFNSLFK